MELSDCVQLKSFRVQVSPEQNIIPGSNGGFTVYWNNLTYSVYTSSIDLMLAKMSGTEVSDSRRILNSICGSFSTGQMTALMGPSGAGKTTLLECLIGKRVHGLSGQINTFHHNPGKTSSLEIQMALVPQFGEFFELLNVREVLMFASKLKNASRPGVDHEKVVKSLLYKLDMVKVSNSNVSNLSGSERKRLSIGNELVSSPNLLVLDEPTTGLDSVAAQMVVKLCHNLSKNSNMAVIMTIHQPSWSLMEKFDKIYMLSPKVKKCIFEGSPQDIAPRLALLNYQVEGSGIPPPDYLTNIASGIDCSMETLDIMASDQKREFEHMFSKDRMLKDRTLDSSMSKVSPPFWTTFVILFYRSFILTLRDITLFCSQLIAAIFLALVLLMMFSGVRDVDNGCPPVIEGEMNSEKYKQASVDIETTLANILTTRKVNFYAFSIMFFIAACTALACAPDLSIIWKERKNNWYHTSVYFLAKTVSDLILRCFPIALIVCAIFPINAADFHDIWRPVLLFAVMFIVSEVTFSQTQIVTFLLRDSSETTKVFVSLNLLLFNVMFVGLFKPTYLVNEGASVLTHMDILNYAINLEYIAYFGYDVCGDHLEEEIDELNVKIIDWAYRHFAYADVDHETIFENQSLGLTNETFYMQGFARSLAQGITGLFISQDGEARSLGLVYSLELIDTDTWRCLTIMVLMLFYAKLGAFIVFLRVSNERF